MGGYDWVFPWLVATLTYFDASICIAYKKTRISCRAFEQLS
jgi:hypothetical protein